MTDEAKKVSAPVPGVTEVVRKRHFEILAEAMAEVKATSDGGSDQPIADIVAGCIAEINALPALAASVASEPQVDRYKTGLQVLATTWFKGDEYQDYAKHVLGASEPSALADAGEPVAWLCSKRDDGGLDIAEPDAVDAFPVYLVGDGRIPPVAWLARGIKPDGETVPDADHIGRLVTTYKGGPPNKLWWSEAFPVFSAALSPGSEQLRRERDEARLERDNYELLANSKIVAHKDLQTKEYEARLAAAETRAADLARKLEAAKEPAWQDVIAERRRQVEAEGWTPEHDDSEHGAGELAIAAACYAISGGGDNQVRHLLAEKRWNLYEGNRVVTVFYWLWTLTIKWSSDWFKPSSRRRDLVKAGALILAEIERLDRAALAQLKETDND